MIVKYTGIGYKFTQDEKILNVFLAHELESLFRGKIFSTTKLDGLNIVFLETGDTINLIDVYSVAHNELKPLIAERIFREQQSLIYDLYEQVQTLRFRTAKF